MLSADEVGELQQEGIQYYHRYISFFQLSDYQGVIRDTQRNLDMFNFRGRSTRSRRSWRPRCCSSRPTC